MEAAGVMAAKVKHCKKHCDFASVGNEAVVSSHFDFLAIL